jgi:hypothetical protein
VRPSTLVLSFSWDGRSCPLLLPHLRLASFQAVKDSGDVSFDGFSGSVYPSRRVVFFLRSELGSCQADLFERRDGTGVGTLG